MHQKSIHLYFFVIFTLCCFYLIFYKINDQYNSFFRWCNVNKQCEVRTDQYRGQHETANLSTKMSVAIHTTVAS